MAEANEELVRQGYKAFGEGDMDTLRSLFAPDAVHVATGNNPRSGEKKGIDEILAFYGKLFELSEGTFSAVLKDVKVEGDDTVVATHHDGGQRAGKTLDQDETLTFTISGGKFTPSLGGSLHWRTTDPSTTSVVNTTSCRRGSPNVG